ncbi:hypothetical protein EK21DRAFT_118179 [Setomelanomma holmii]|uniref:Uncharacterized protein n=1 Tax=Setomelanomma holmii TaxID=210430 RepID=A0A9P4LF42_9PLEO|nr:hypothetical protein EK21DRAFT_118179 [Setomelanomma holmii]
MYEAVSQVEANASKHYRELKKEKKEEVEMYKIFADRQLGDIKRHGWRSERQESDICELKRQLAAKDVTIASLLEQRNKKWNKYPGHAKVVKILSREVQGHQKAIDKNVKGRTRSEEQYSRRNDMVKADIEAEHHDLERRRRKLMKQSVRVEVSFDASPETMELKKQFDQDVQECTKRIEALDNRDVKEQEELQRRLAECRDVCERNLKERYVRMRKLAEIARACELYERIEWPADLMEDTGVEEPLCPELDRVVEAFLRRDFE